MDTLIKIGVLLSGIQFPLLGSFLILLDGKFHLSSSKSDLIEHSPDWIIARAFNKKGLSEEIHKFMGIILISISILYMTIRLLKIKKFNLTYYMYINRITLIIISIALFLKWHYGEKSDVAFF
jgi:hypothetical protein